MSSLRERLNEFAMIRPCWVAALMAEWPAGTPTRLAGAALTDEQTDALETLLAQYVELVACAPIELGEPDPIEGAPAHPGLVRHAHVLLDRFAAAQTEWLADVIAEAACAGRPISAHQGRSERRVRILLGLAHLATIDAEFEIPDSEYVALIAASAAHDQRLAGWTVGRALAALDWLAAQRFETLAANSDRLVYVTDADGDGWLQIEG